MLKFYIYVLWVPSSFRGADRGRTGIWQGVAMSRVALTPPHQSANPPAALHRLSAVLYLHNVRLNRQKRKMPCLSRLSIYLLVISPVVDNIWIVHEYGTRL